MSTPPQVRPPDFAANPRFDRAALLGIGAFGEVYRVRDRDLDMDVAVKCLGAVSADAVTRLKAEFRAVAALAHRNLVQLYALFAEGGTAYFTMELVEGVDFIRAAHERTALDPSALRRLVRQLCEGLGALHAVGLVHRDIKPSNVLVTPEGRVVVLDFGFIRDARALPAAPVPTEGVVGTVAYMAPEQLSGLPAGAAADVYAAGAMLHEVLTGAPPAPRYAGRGTSTSTARIRRSDIDPALTAVVSAMLAIDPAARCGMAEVVRRLDGMRAAPATHADAGAFVGRHHERQRLLDAIAGAETGRVLEIHGPSGVGKTEMVRRTLADVGPTAALVLRSRCRPTESVPFQALDAIVDDLGTVIAPLLRDPEVAISVHDPAQAASVLFASLLRLSGGPPAPAMDDDDPIEARRAGVAALRALFMVAAQGRRLVVWIDDAHWADADSIELIADLVGTTDPLPACWIVTTRTTSAETSVLGRRLATLVGPHGVVRYDALGLGPLDGADASSLVRYVAGPSVPLEALAQIVDAGRGSPFLLASFAASVGDGDGPALLEQGFSALLARRIGDLEDEERRLLELSALCRQPTDRTLLLEAAGLGARGLHVVQRLEGRRLLTSTPSHGTVVIDSYHDQIPETLLVSLSDDARREGHGRLARAHRARDSEPAVLAHHFQGAGELAEAATYAELGGKRAEATLAFATAAELFRSARLWNPRLEPAQAAALLESESKALAYAGSLAAAGERYLEAAASTDGDGALELRRRGVESLLAGGHLEQGLDEFRSLIGRLDLDYPKSELGALAGGIGALVAYLLRPGQRSRVAAGPTELLTIDTCYSVGRRLADIDPSRGSYFLMRSLVRAARAGDAARLARSLCTAGGALGAVGGRVINRIGDVMMARASRIADELGHEELLGMIDVAYGEILMLGGRWREALARSRIGVERLHRKPGFVFECNVGRGVVLRALEELGEVREEYAEGRALLEAAQSHHNAYAEIRAAQHLTIAALALDRSDEARSYLRVGFDRWMEGAFQMQHLYARRNEVLCDLYEGHVVEAAALLERVEREFRRSVLRQIPLIRIDLTWLRGQLALTLAPVHQRSRHLGAAEEAARSLERERRCDATLRAGLLRAGVASWTDVGRARNVLTGTEAAAADAGMRAIGTAAALQRCRWSADETGAATAAADLTSYGVGSPDRYAAAMVPGRPV